MVASFHRPFNNCVHFVIVILECGTEALLNLPKQLGISFKKNEKNEKRTTFEKNKKKDRHFEK